MRSLPGDPKEGSVFFSLTDKERAALTEAADAIYFGDSSKHLPALWSIVHLLVGDVYDSDILAGKLFPILHSEVDADEDR